MSDTVKVHLPHNYESLDDCLAAFSAVPENEKLCTAIMALDDTVDTLWGDLYAATRTLQLEITAKQNEIAREHASGSRVRIQKLEGEVATLLDAVKITTNTLQDNAQALKRKRPTSNANDAQMLLSVVRMTTNMLEKNRDALVKGVTARP